jgi:hypothetical protein
MTDFTEGSRMRTNAGFPKTKKPDIIPKGQKPMTEPDYKIEELYNTEELKMNTNEAVENKLKQQLVSDLKSKNWYVDMREFVYPILEVVDENTVKIDGVEYKKVEKQEPQTLYKTLCLKTGMSRQGCEKICDTVRGWLIDHTVIETEDAEKVTFTIHKEQLQTPK